MIKSVKKRASQSLIAACLVSLSGMAIAQTQISDIDKISQVPAVNTIKDSRSVYIVQLEDEPIMSYSGGVENLQATIPQADSKLDLASPAVQSYSSYLDNKMSNVINSNGISSSDLIYTYKSAFNGMAVKMSANEAEELRNSSGVKHVWKDELLKLETNTTRHFLRVGGSGEIWSQGYSGEDMIVGVLDSGIYPEHPSFADEPTATKVGNTVAERNRRVPFGEPPERWTGNVCDFGNTDFNSDDADFECNNKLLGARHYIAGFLGGRDPAEALSPGSSLSARDDDGHGSATAQNAAGNTGVRARPEDEDQFVQRSRVTSGMAPRARIAAYKVCWTGPEPGTVDDGCASSDSMAAIEQAIADGVDVINFSIGGSSTSFGGPDSIAFLAAANAGVWVATSAGNSGSSAGTVGAPGIVPWITSVGAINDGENRALAVSVQTPASIAGLNTAVEGAGPVTVADNPTSGSIALSEPANGCDPLTNGGAINGNIALVIRGGCAFNDKYINAQNAGASSIIVYNDGTAPDRVNPFVMGGIDQDVVTIPGVMIGFNDGDAIAQALQTSEVTATLSDEIQTNLINTMAGFSSRGPNNGALDLIKPDLAAPGVNIYSAETPFESEDSGNGGNTFQFISGTSFSSPHVAGLMALLRQAHPDWSPAMGKSALMTTARQSVRKDFPESPTDFADPFDIGAGVPQVTQALDPGLVYDANILDYAAFSCGNNVQLVSDATCAALAAQGFSFEGSELNLPSIGVGALAGTKTVTRTVTNVSDNPGVHRYIAEVEAPPGIRMRVTPRVLKLASGESADYTVTFRARPGVVDFDEFGFGSLTWVEAPRRNSNIEPHTVYSPVAVRPTRLETPAAVNSEGASGQISVPVTFGYNGRYSASFEGLAPATRVSGVAPAAAPQFQIQCFDVAEDSTHLRAAIFNESTNNPGQDDLDLRLFSVNNCTDFEDLALIGSSGNGDSNEQIDIVNPAAGGYAVVIDWFSSVSGGDVDYELFFTVVNGDEGNATVDSLPNRARVSSSEEIVIGYEVDAATRYLGIINHSSGGDQIGQTFIEVDATDSADVN